MSDFFQSGADEIDFDRAVSAFPDISLDGEGEIPVLPQAPPATKSNPSDFLFDDFDGPGESTVKVTGDDDIEKFQSNFPDIDVGQVSRSLWFYSVGSPKHWEQHCFSSNSFYRKGDILDLYHCLLTTIRILTRSNSTNLLQFSNNPPLAQLLLHVHNHLPSLLLQS